MLTIFAHLDKNIQQALADKLLPQGFFPAAYERGGDAVAAYIGGAAAHIQNLINGQQQQQTGLGDMEH